MKPYRFRFIKVGTCETPNFVACKAILENEYSPYTEEIDGRNAIILSRGKINPSGGFVIVAPDDTVLLDYFDLTKWIEAKGLRNI